jgi:hypothetical protein
MNHDDFRLAAGADPLHLAAEHLQHMADCADCRDYHAQLLALEARVGAALRIAVPPAPPVPVAAPVPVATPETGAVPETIAAPVASAAAGMTGRPRSWRYGLAASLAVATVVSALLIFGYSQQSLAHAVAMHADGEPESFLTSAPEDPAALAHVMATTGVQLLPGGPTVTYARNCPLRGHTVAHLVVHTPQGPVVVLVMTHETVASRRAFSDHGYHGVLVPTSHGSLAVLSAGDQDVDAVVAAVDARIRYLQ